MSEPQAREGASGDSAAHKAASWRAELALAEAGVCVAGKRLLEGLTFTISAKRIAVVGRNGSGKSTLARLLAGLVPPSTGTVFVQGFEPAKDRAAALRDIGLLFQNPDHQIIFPTVVEELMFGLRQQGHSRHEAWEAAHETLARFGKSHWSDAVISTLSQGQKHLVCIMAIVAMTPKVIILDEPFTGLDIPTKAQLSRHLGHYPGALVHISHDPDDLRQYDQAIWLEKGKPVKIGGAEAVLSAYSHAMTELGGLDDLSDLANTDLGA